MEETGAQKTDELLNKRVELLRALNKEGIDPGLLIQMLDSELDRALKKKLGYWFMGLTVFFALLSYIVIMFNHKLFMIEQYAITALIIETPLQFIGLLYIIAKNLFPQGQVTALDPNVRTGIRTAPHAG